MREVRVAFIDDLSPYSKCLYSKLIAQHKSKFQFVFYAPNGVVGKLSGHGDLPNMKRVWSSHLYPFQITREVAKDKPDIVHLQFELNTFGSHYTSLLVLPLLIFLRVLRRKVVLTIHTVIPKAYITREFTTALIPSIFRILRMPPMVYKIILEILYSFSSRFSEELILHTTAQKELLIHDYGVIASKIHIISQGVDYEKPDPNPEKVQFWKNTIKKRK